MTDSLFARSLADFCRRAIAPDGELGALDRLTSGANMESWRFVFGPPGDTQDYVLRREPEGMAVALDDLGTDDAISLDAQASLIEAAREAGVAAPKIIARLTADDELGQGFVMDCVPGEALPHKILGQPSFAAAEAALTAQCARELAHIHAIPLTKVPHELSHRPVATMLADLRARYRMLGGRSPILQLTFGWLARNMPEGEPKALLHGDFRMGNLLIGADGITGVLDWELAHIGDPVQDLAYLCMPSWRFGRHDKPVGGFGDIDALLSAYAKASGTAIDRARFDFWLVYATIWWGVCCLSMTAIWRSGADRSVERIVIGRRKSEVEIDLLLLLEDLLALGGRSLNWRAPPLEPSHGEPAVHELLTAVQSWAQDSAIPAAEGRAKFEARVATNAIGMAMRETAWDSGFAADALARLQALRIDRNTLGKGLEDGSIAPDDQRVWDHLRLHALERCSVDQPKYVGLKTALQRWCGHDGEN